MRVEAIEPDVLVFHGDAYQGVATAFLNDGDALLVDALASRADAEWMRHELEVKLAKRVRTIVATHYMSDHLAGLPLFPEAQVLAQRLFSYTFLSQRGRTVEDDQAFVRPTATFADGFRLEWGRHALRAFHNPGKSVCSIAIDVADCDLLLCGDAVVGNIAYLSGSSPELVGDAIVRLQALGRRRIIPGHVGVLDGGVFANARFYLARLRQEVRSARRASSAPERILRIRVDDCVAAGVQPTAFEREWHGQNLERILERQLFTIDA